MVSIEKKGLGGYYYVLDEDGQPREVDSLICDEWMRNGQRKLAADCFPGGTTVSTVFLGLNHRLAPGYPPILWETMIFGGRHDEYQERYASREEALAGHARAVELARPGWLAGVFLTVADVILRLLPGR